MTGIRVDGYGLSQPDGPLSFTFDGKPYTARPGDTLAAALLASGVSIVGRSFKYHRPRGLWGAWSDDPNGIADITLDGAHFANCQLTTTYVKPGMKVRSVNAYPSARTDIKGGLDLFSRFMPAGFYYKTFMWPNWHLFEPAIRKMAGLGQASTEVIEGYRAKKQNDRCDLLVVGAGASGLTAARAAAESGQDVLLVDDHAELGGSLYAMGAGVEGREAKAWVSDQREACLSAGVRIMARTTAIGVHDHNLVSLVQDHGLGAAPDLWRIRAKRILLATGAIERPLQFTNNDVPGIMSAFAATEYLGRYGVLAGRDVAILSNNTQAETAAEILQGSGASVRLLDGSVGAARALGRKKILGVRIGEKDHQCDVLLVSGGLTPSVHLWCHAGGKLAWNEQLEAFLPVDCSEHVQVTGAAAGFYDLDAALEDALAKAVGRLSTATVSSFDLKPHWRAHTGPGRKWVDLQSDVTVKDVQLAANEGFQSVEHLKRYTTLGMATDQGKTSNMPGLMVLADTLKKPVPDVGTTRFRPPYTPVPLETFSGPRRGTNINPLKRLVLEPLHRELGAALGEYGGILRPGWYGDFDGETAAQKEAVYARQAVGVFDGSPLGKIEVIGPDAAAFLDFVYYNTISTLKPGRIRYGFMLHETGVIFDDGVVARLEENRFIISCSSSHVDAVTLWLENWRQDRFDRKRVFIHNVTQGWATIAVTGPKARQVLAALDTGVNLSSENLLHMAFDTGTFGGFPARVARVSFTGDLSFEISVPNPAATALWDRALAMASEFGGGPIGVEALTILRAQKGYIVIGKDTDGETMPHDLGFVVPRDKKKTPFVGDRSLHTHVANRDDRLQLVGLSVGQGSAKLPVGAHAIELQDGKRRSIGFVTSSYEISATNEPVALALIAAGRSRIGQTIDLWHLGQRLSAVAVAPVFFDLEGERLNA
ncbi:2Fe-2S iron-sulfur cluster-binding protein [Ruegeria atlantica]|uniref:2Fe-2S iron-sulfur cluster-binding protein n=1 Tax=Ruegeria atlantica TaxID=81569 RepID=UPI00147EFDC2|nr:2Fe-2S iron-sulfur cluster-binding protein [Ruegeria atlantica]